MLKFNILTLFPEYFQTPLKTSILDRARQSGQVQYNLIDIRDFAADKHRVTDEPPYGGGPGMVMKVEPIDKALQSLNVKPGQKNRIIILSSAKGQLFTQQKAQSWSQYQEVTIICGHYQGVDDRVAQHLVDQEIRIGSYVLTGGEPAALVMADAVTRLLPGVLGNEDSLKQESHTQPGIAGYPVYTRPEKYKDWSVPSVLLSGDHQAIKKWRQQHQKQLSDQS